MKILAINGSYRGNNGFTSACIERLLQGATEAGADCETISLAGMKINACTGCQVCHTESHLLKCIFDEKDDTNVIFGKMRDADIIIFATPVYIFSMSSLLKKLLDRLNSTGDSSRLTVSPKGLFFHHIDQALCSKPFVTLICCDNMEDETSRNIIDYFRTYARFMDAKQVGTIIRKSGKLIGHGRDVSKEKLFPKIADVYKAINDAGKELANTGKISSSTCKRVSESILPIPPLAGLFMKFGFVKKRFLPVILQKIGMSMK